MLEHPVITRINKTGYPTKEAQPDHAGNDYFGDEVLVGDNVIHLPDGEVLLEGNLEDYLIEVLGFRFKKAE